MNITGFFRSQLRSVIEWDTADPGDFFERWNGTGDEIKNASKLVIKPGQGAVFVNEGRVEAVHIQEGIYDLKTANIPFITTISKFMQAFESEYKVGIYFFWRTDQLNHRWGTPSPIKYLDPVYKIPVSLRAHGNFSFRLTSPEQFFVNIVGARDTFSVDELRQVLGSRLIQPLTDVFATAGHAVTEIDKHRISLSEKTSESFKADCSKLGLELTDFRIEGTEFDEGTMARVSLLADTVMEGQAANQVGIDFTQLQQLKALRDAAKNPGGAAGAGIGLGAGIAMGQQFAQQFSPSSSSGTSSPAVRLKQLKDLLDAGIITTSEYETKKKEILSQL